MAISAKRDASTLFRRFALHLLEAYEAGRGSLRELAETWWEQVSELDHACLVFLDESGVATEMTRRYLGEPQAERLWEAVPVGHWRTLTVLAALTTAGRAGQHDH